MLNPHRGARRPTTFQPLLTRSEIAEGSLFSAATHKTTIFVYVRARARWWGGRPSFLWLSSDTGVTPGYGGIVPPRFLGQRPVCASERVWHLHQIFVLAAGRPRRWDTASLRRFSVCGVSGPAVVRLDVAGKFASWSNALVTDLFIKVGIGIAEFIMSFFCNYNSLTTADLCPAYRMAVSFTSSGRFLSSQLLFH